MGSNVVYQLKITLEEIEPPIWRRVLVPQGITFYKLHKIIQAAFGWQDYHLFDFDFGDVAVHIPDPDYAPGELHGGAKELNAREQKSIPCSANAKNASILTTLEITGGTRWFWKKYCRPRKDGVTRYALRGSPRLFFFQERKTRVSGEHFQGTQAKRS